MLKKCYLLKEKILGLCLGCPQHNKENKGIIFLSLQNNGNRPYAADNQDIAPEFFPLRDNIFLANVKSSFFPEIEIKFRVFCNRPNQQATKKDQQEERPTKWMKMSSNEWLGMRNE